MAVSLRILKSKSDIPGGSSIIPAEGEHQICQRRIFHRCAVAVDVADPIPQIELRAF